MEIGIIGEDLNIITYNMLLKSLNCKKVKVVWFVDAKISIKKRKKMYGESFDYGIFQSLRSFKDIFFVKSCEKMCKIHGIPYIVPENYDINNGLPEEMYTNPKTDYVLVVGCDQLLNEKGLKLAKQKTINYHYSPLPAYRGKFVLFWQWYKKERYIGYSFHEIDLGIDTGKIIYQNKVETVPHEPLINLTKRVLDISSDHICEVYDCLMSDKSIVLNEEILPSYYPSKMYLDLITVSSSRKIQDILNVFQQVGFIRLINGLTIRKVVSVDTRRIAHYEIEDIGIRVPLMDGHIVVRPSGRIPFIIFRIMLGKNMIVGCDEDIT